MVVIIGNVIGLIGSLFMVIGGAQKNKDRALISQTLQMLLLSFSNLVLGSISGFIMDLISVLRNILSTKGKLNKITVAIIIITSTILTIRFNSIGPIGYLPLINNTIFILFMNTKSHIKFKALTIIYMLLWLIHNVYIKAYTTSAFNCMTIISSIIAIYRINKTKSSNNEEAN